MALSLASSVVNWIRPKLRGFHCLRSVEISRAKIELLPSWDSRK